MAALGKKFITVNNVLLPETSSFSIDVETLEKEFQTEDGHDQSILIRTGKHTFNVAWENQPGSFLDDAKSICSTPTVTVLIDSVSYTCRGRGLKADMVRYSNRYKGSKGLWNISFQLKEI